MGNSLSKASDLLFKCCFHAITRPKSVLILCLKVDGHSKYGGACECMPDDYCSMHLQLNWMAERFVTKATFLKDEQGR
jgi:hypothetical protein